MLAAAVVRWTGGVAAGRPRGHRCPRCRCPPRWLAGAGHPRPLAAACRRGRPPRRLARHTCHLLGALSRDPQLIGATRHRRPPLTAAASPDGDVIAVADPFDGVTFLNRVTLDEVGTVRDPAWTLEFSPDGEQLAVVANDWTPLPISIKIDPLPVLLDPRTSRSEGSSAVSRTVQRARRRIQGGMGASWPRVRRRQRTATPHDGDNVTAMVLSPDGTQVAVRTGTRSSSSMRRRCSSAACKAIPRTSTNSGSPTTARCLHRRRPIRPRSSGIIATGEPVDQLRGHAEGVGSLAFSADDATLYRVDRSRGAGLGPHRYPALHPTPRRGATRLRGPG